MESEKKWKSFERMNNELYKYGVVINYNTNPILKEKAVLFFYMFGEMKTE